MKKIILLLIVGFTTLMGIEFTMTKSGLYPNIETPPTEGTTPTDGWVGKPLPTKAFNVLDYGLKGDGVTDDSAALKALGKNTNVTNWYFPAGKTFLLVGVTPPPHVTHVWGPGTLKRKITGEKWQKGIFEIMYTAVYDGLTIINGTGDWQGSASIGQFVLSYQNPALPEWSSDGIEIRNCTFDASGIYSDSISAFTGYNYDGNHPEYNHRNKHKNLKIYNNTFKNSSHFAMEIGDRPLPSAQDQNGYLGLEIFNNVVIGPGNGFSLDHITAASNAKVYNNKFNNLNWGVELASTGGIHVYNNLMLGMKRHPIVSNGFFARNVVSGKRDEFVTNEWNYVHNNHIESVNDSNNMERIRLYAGAKVEFYDNFLKTSVWVDQPTDTQAGEWKSGPNIHNNTILGEFMGQAVYINQDTDGSSIIDNNIYTIGNSGQTGIYINAAATNTLESQNNIYIKVAGKCVNGIIQTGGTCTLNYTGTVPTSRSGAGLSDPNNIGVQ